MTVRPPGVDADGVLAPVHVRAGVEDLAELHAMRDKLVAGSARLTALHGPFGLWDDRRKEMLALCELKVRDEMLAAGTHYTEAKIAALARTHPEMVSANSRAVEEKASWIVLNNQLNTLNGRIRSRETEMHFVRAEMGLAR